MTASSQEKTLTSEVIPTSFAHRGFTLIGSSLIIFEILFLILYTNQFWFAADLLVLGVPIVILTIFITHSALCWLEEPVGCELFSFLLNGTPPLVYQRWLTFNEQGIIFGTRRLLWDSIDEITLTLFGNLLVKTRKLCGAMPAIDNRSGNQLDTILKLPIHAITASCQQRFIQILKGRQRSVAENSRLTRQLSQPFLKAASLVQGLGVVFLALVFIDFGYSECRFLEMLKEYYLCIQSCQLHTTNGGTLHWTRAESIRLHPLPISWISRQFMQQGKLNSIIAEVRSQALLQLGKKGEALQSILDSINSSPKIVAYRLHAARLYLSLDKRADAKEQIIKACDQNKDSLLPRLYMLSLLMSAGESKEAASFYQTYSKQLQEKYFGEEPIWPPGGQTFLHALFYQEDLDFIFNKLLKI